MAQAARLAGCRFDGLKSADQIRQGAFVRRGEHDWHAPPVQDRLEFKKTVPVLFVRQTHLKDNNITC